MNVNCGRVRGRRIGRWRNSNAYRPALLSLDDSKSGRLLETGREPVGGWAGAGGEAVRVIRAGSVVEIHNGAPGRRAWRLCVAIWGKGATDDRRRRHPRLLTQPQLTFAGATQPYAAAVVDPLPYIALMGAGFVIGVAGHLYRSNAAIAAGIGIILVATLVPIGVYLSDR